MAVGVVSGFCRPQEARLTWTYMELKPAKVAATLVLVGPVNPVMFHPEWFKHNELLKAAEADDAELQVLSPNITMFKNDWLEVDIRPERIQLRTQQEPYFPVLRDLGLGILRCMPRVPFVQLGYNWEYFYKFQDAEDYHNLGHSLAPKEPWGDKMIKPGMVSLIMRSERADDWKGVKNYTVRPDLQSASGLEAIIAVNDHVTFEEDKPKTPARAIECIESYWEQSRLDFEEVASHLIRGI